MIDENTVQYESTLRSRKVVTVFNNKFDERMLTYGLKMEVYSRAEK